MGKNCYCVVCHYFVIVRAKRRRVLVTNATCIGHLRVLGALQFIRFGMLLIQYFLYTCV